MTSKRPWLFTKHCSSPNLNQIPLGVAEKDGNQQFHSMIGIVTAPRDPTDGV